MEINCYEFIFSHGTYLYFASYNIIVVYVIEEMSLIQSVHYQRFHCMYVSTEVAMCGDPGRIFPLLGRRLVEGTREGARVTYSCVRGLVLVDGDEERTCLSSGEWSGSLPRCSGEVTSSMK